MGVNWSSISLLPNLGLRLLPSGHYWYTLGPFLFFFLRQAGSKSRHTPRGGGMDIPELSAVRGFTALVV